MTRATTRPTIHRFLTMLLVAVVGSTVAVAPAFAERGRGDRDRDGHRYEQRWDDRDQRGYDRYDQRGHGDRRYDDRRYDDRRDGYHYREPYSRPRGPRFVVPRRIQVGYHDSYYDPYRHGRAYYGPHRHYHEVYFFPVVVGGLYRYQPYYYCEGALYSAGAYFDGYAGPPRRSGLWFGFRIGF